MLRLTCINILFICQNDFLNRSPIMVHPPCPPSNIRMTSSKLDLARDIFKCVMCHERFNSLEGLTRHLKETDHSAISAAISANPDRQRHHTETSTPENSPSTFSRWVALKRNCIWGAESAPQMPQIGRHYDVMTCRHQGSITPGVIVIVILN